MPTRDVDRIAPAQEGGGNAMSAHGSTNAVRNAPMEQAHLKYEAAQAEQAAMTAKLNDIIRRNNIRRGVAA